MAGKEFINNNYYNKGIIELNIKELANGIYFIKVIGEKQTVIQKFVKE